MDKPLKTAYELAQTRWIMPSERPRPDKLGEDDYVPDYVESWKNPNKNDDDSEYDRSFVPVDMEQARSMNKKNYKNRGFINE